MTTNTSNSTYDDLVRLSDEKAKTLIPIMIFFGMFMVMGFIGNSFVCYIMGFRFQTSNQNLLIVSLAILDLISCLLTMSKGILEMRFMYIFPSDTLCKLLRLVAAFTSTGSVLVLTVIAVERYKKICKPLAPQFTHGQTRIALAISLTGAVLLSVPTIFIYGIRTYESPVKGQKAHDCFTSDRMINTSIPILYTTVLFTVFIICCVIIIVIYGSILYSLKQHGRKMSTINISVVRFIREKFSSLKNVTPPSIRQMGIVDEKGSRKSATKAKADSGQSSTEKGRKNTLANLRHSKLQGTESQDNDQGEQLGQPKKDESNEKNKHEWKIKKNNVTSNTEYLSGGCPTTTIRPTGVPEITNLEDISDSDSNFASSHFDYRISQDPDSEMNTGGHSQSNTSEATQTTELYYQSMTSHNQYPFMIPLEALLNEQSDALETKSKISFPSSSDSNICACGDPEKTNKAESQRACAIRESKDTDFDTTRKSLRDDCAEIFHIKENNGNKDTKLANRKTFAPKAKTKVTRIAFLVTLVFILSFLPHLSLRVCKNIFKGFDYNLEGAPLILYNLFLRSYYMNSIANPIIYGALNIRFRAEVKVLYQKLCFK